MVVLRRPRDLFFPNAINFFPSPSSNKSGRRRTTEILGLSSRNPVLIKSSPRLEHYLPISSYCMIIRIPGAAWRPDLVLILTRFIGARFRTAKSVPVITTGRDLNWQMYHFYFVRVPMIFGPRSGCRSLRCRIYILLSIFSTYDFFRWSVFCLSYKPMRRFVTFLYRCCLKSAREFIYFCRFFSVRK